MWITIVNMIVDVINEREQDFSLRELHAMVDNYD